MLPNSNHLPTKRPQAGVRVPVAGHVRFDLGSPPSGVCFWPGSVNRAGVPEAAVDEHADLQPWECNVRAAACPWDLPLQSVPEAQSRQFAADSQFAGRVSARGDLHAPADFGGRSFRPVRLLLRRHRTSCSSHRAAPHRRLPTRTRCHFAPGRPDMHRPGTRRMCVPTSDGRSLEGSTEH
jgi:hypothetical protein